jgi:hypothetical protein
MEAAMSLVDVHAPQPAPVESGSHAQRTQEEDQKKGSIADILNHRSPPPSVSSRKAHTGGVGGPFDKPPSPPQVVAPTLPSPESEPEFKDVEMGEEDEDDEEEVVVPAPVPIPAATPSRAGKGRRFTFTLEVPIKPPKIKQERLLEFPDDEDDESSDELVATALGAKTSRGAFLCCCLFDWALLISNR